MPFCPKCRYEYEEGIFRCPDCDEPLVDRLEEDKKGEEYKDWIEIARLTSPQFAQMVLEVLHEKEIPAVISSSSGFFGETGQMGIASFAPAGGGFSLLVPEKFVSIADKEAALVLGEVWEKSKLFDIEEEEE